MPVPDSGTVSGLPGALDVTCSDPLAAPAAVGSNCTLTVHEAPAPRDVPQVLVCANEPLTASCEIDTELLPGLVTLTCWALLSCPVTSSPNGRLDGEAVSAAWVPPPE